MKPLTPAENHRYNKFKKLMKEGDCNTESEIMYMLSRTRVWWRWAQYYAFFAVGLITFLLSTGMVINDLLSGHAKNVTLLSTSMMLFWCGMGILFMYAPSAYRKNLNELDDFGVRLIAENAKNDG